MTLSVYGHWTQRCSHVCSCVRLLALLTSAGQPSGSFSQPSAPSARSPNRQCTRNSSSASFAVKFGLTSELTAPVRAHSLRQFGHCRLAVSELVAHLRQKEWPHTVSVTGSRWLLPKSSKQMVQLSESRGGCSNCSTVSSGTVPPARLRFLDITSPVGSSPFPELTRRERTSVDQIRLQGDLGPTPTASKPTVITYQGALKGVIRFPALGVNMQQSKIFTTIKLKIHQDCSKNNTDFQKYLNFAQKHSKIAK